MNRLSEGANQRKRKPKQTNMTLFSIFIKKEIRLKLDKLSVAQNKSRGRVIETALELYMGTLSEEELKDVA